MNTLSLTSYERLRKFLQSVPKSQVHNYCRMFGYHNTSPALHQL